MTRFFVAFILSCLVGSSVWAAPVPFGYGFLGGDGSPNEDAAESTWNDIHYACNFTDASALQNAIDQVDANNTILISLTRVWQDHSPICNDDGPWGNLALFTGRMSPLLSVLKNNKDRLFALWLFDEPDIDHGGPSDGDLQAAVDFLHQQVPGVPVFVNWFIPANNPRVPNADWHSTTKGATPSALADLGKPMFLWWFANHANPRPRTIASRWTSLVDYHYRTAPTPITGVGWCCDSIENFTGPVHEESSEFRSLLKKISKSDKNLARSLRLAYERGHKINWKKVFSQLDWFDSFLPFDFFKDCCGGEEEVGTVLNDNATELDALLAYIGKARRDTGSVFRAAYVGGADWRLFQREKDRSLSWTSSATFPTYSPLPIGGASDFYPAVVRETNGEQKIVHVVMTGTDGVVSHSSYSDGTWSPWFSLGISSNEKPTLLSKDGERWLAIRGEDNAIYVKRLGEADGFTALGGVAASAPHLKIVNQQLRVVMFGTDGQVYGRTWDGQTWGPWLIEP
jgi:hypothetical protein